MGSKRSENLASDTALRYVRNTILLLQEILKSQVSQLVTLSDTISCADSEDKAIDAKTIQKCVSRNPDTKLDTSSRKSASTDLLNEQTLSSDLQSVMFKMRACLANASHSLDSFESNLQTPSENNFKKTAENSSISLSDIEVTNSESITQNEVDEMFESLRKSFVEKYVKVSDCNNEERERYDDDNVLALDSASSQNNSISSESMKNDLQNMPEESLPSKSFKKKYVEKTRQNGKEGKKDQYEDVSQSMRFPNYNFRKHLNHGVPEQKTPDLGSTRRERQINPMVKTKPYHDSSMVDTQIDELSTLEKESLVKENRNLRRQLNSLKCMNGEIMAELGQIIVEKTAKESEERKAAIFQKIYHPFSSSDKRSDMVTSDDDKVSKNAKLAIANANQSADSPDEEPVQGAQAVVNGIVYRKKERFPVRNNDQNNSDMASLRNSSEPQRHSVQINSEASGGERVHGARNVQAAVVSASSDRSQNDEQRLTRQTSERLSFSVQQDYSNESEYISLGNVPSTSAPTSALTTVCYNYKLLILSLGQVLLAEDVTKLKEWAAQNFSIENAQNATHILLQLDQKGIINASNLKSLRDFLESIVRIDLVHIIDSFLLGDYKLLRSIPASKIRPQSSQYGSLLGGASSTRPAARYGTGNTTYLQSMPENSSSRHNSSPQNNQQAAFSWSSTARTSAYTSRSPNENHSTDDVLAKPKTVATACTETSVVVADGLKTAESPSGARNTSTIGSNGLKHSKFQPSDPDQDDNWLCSHYKRHCYVKFDCCDRFWPCHRCHNNQSNCGRKKLKSRDTKMVKCAYCNKVQPFGEHCRQCKAKFAKYFCGLCQHLTGNDDHPYHCDKCGICRIHGDRSFHCDICGVCLDVQLRGNHKCREGSAHDECCICLEDAFTGCQILPCSHKVHKECATQMIRSGITRCPICRESFAHKLERRSTSNSRKRLGK